MSNNSVTTRDTFYDLDQIKQIPILDVCKRMLGLKHEERSGKVWCKARSEDAASTLLHPDKNTFYDFGTNKHGDVIDFVAYVLGIDGKEAIKQLAHAYEVPPKDNRRGLDHYELTLWEYERIGIAGDKATKNAGVFDVMKMTYQELCEVSEQCDMTMNELRRKYPDVYENIISQTALPYVRSLRNDYFLSVWCRYHTMCYVGKPELFYRPDALKVFDDSIKELRQAEKVLERAIFGTKIKLRPFPKYDPVKDLEKITEGKLKPAMGPLGYEEMQTASKDANSPIKYRTVDFEKFMIHMANAPENLKFSAFLKADRVVVGYLQKDYGRMKPYFEKMCPPKEQDSQSSRSSYSRTSSSFRKDKKSEPER